jgi:hypothetical protein
MTTTKILLRGGDKADLPLSAELHEILLVRDTGELYYGMGPGEPLLKIGGGSVLDKDITDQIDGTKTIFNVGEAYMPGSLVVYFCMARLRKSSEETLYDFSELDPDAGSFEFHDRVPQTGDIIIVSYNRKINI